MEFEVRSNRSLQLLSVLMTAVLVGGTMIYAFS